MSRLTTKELVLVDAIPPVAPSPPPVPIPIPLALKPPSSVAAPHGREPSKPTRSPETTSPVGAWEAEEGGTAYCGAMPMLASYEGIRDFVACAAHGILIGAIPAERSGQLLYAAQVALNVLHSGTGKLKSPSK